MKYLFIVSLLLMPWMGHAEDATAPTQFQQNENAPLNAPSRDIASKKTHGKSKHKQSKHKKSKKKKNG